MSKKYDGKPCVARGMRIPADKMTQLASRRATSGRLTISWDIDEMGPGPYSAVLMRATNAKGNSIFTIVHSDDVCFKCTY